MYAALIRLGTWAATKVTRGTRNVARRAGDEDAATRCDDALLALLMPEDRAMAIECREVVARWSP